MKNQKGITLVALVVTIVVLLILAGITIALVLNPENSIFGKAKDAKTETHDANVREAVAVAISGAQIEYYDTTSHSAFAEADRASKSAAATKANSLITTELTASGMTEVTSSLTTFIKVDAPAEGATAETSTIAGTINLKFNGTSYKVTVDYTQPTNVEKVKVEVQ